MKSDLENNDCFKKTFKYYKSNKLVPSFDHEDGIEITNITPENVIEDSRAKFLGLKDVSQWKLLNLHSHPGLLIIKNVFNPVGQRYWIRKCLQEYPRKPNKINLDNELHLDDWWSKCHNKHDDNKKLLKKLRWTTLGYHHNWDTKVYSEINKGQFPNDLAEISDVIAKYLNFKSYKAEAAIINYYHLDSTLSGHTDHSEVNLEAPLFSFSFGQSAIFLIGGRDKTIEPKAILLKSGDVVVMSEEARLCYHAIPRIVKTDEKPWNDYYSYEELETNIDPAFKYSCRKDDLLESMKKLNDDDEWRLFDDYINESRINMNVRQVLNKNQTSLA